MVIRALRTQGLAMGSSYSLGVGIIYKMEIEMLLTGEDWEAINQKAGVDVMDIVVNLDGRYSPTQQADLIV